MRRVLAAMAAMALVSAAAEAQSPRQEIFQRAEAQLILTGPCRAVRLVETVLFIMWIDNPDGRRAPNGSLAVTEEVGPLGPGCVPELSMGVWTIGGDSLDDAGRMKLRAVFGKCQAGGCTNFDLGRRELDFVRLDGHRAAISGLTMISGEGEKVFVGDSVDTSPAQLAYRNVVRAAGDAALPGDRYLMRQALLFPTATTFGGYLVVSSLNLGEGRSAVEVTLLEGDPDNAKVAAHTIN